MTNRLEVRRAIILKLLNNIYKKNYNIIQYVIEDNHEVDVNLSALVTIVNVSIDFIFFVKILKYNLQYKFYLPV